MTTTGPPTANADTDTPPKDWVPVEHRLFGLDRRTIAPALGVFVFLAFLTFGLPAINDAIAVERPVEAGDVMRVGDGVTFVPTVGWNIESGLLVTDDTSSPTPEPALLTQGTVAFSVSADNFDGTANELVDQIQRSTVGVQEIDDFQLITERETISTTSGITGVAQGFTGTATQGVLAAFVVDGYGISVVAYGNTDDLVSYSADIEAMIDSITYTPVPKPGS